MKKILIILLAIGLFSCNKDIKLDVKLSGKSEQNKDIVLNINNINNSNIDNVEILIDGKSLQKIPYQNTLSFTLDNSFKLGLHEIRLDFFEDNQPVFTKKISIELFSGIKPKLLKYQLVKTYEHNPSDFVQGYEFYKDTLYESTGLNGESKIKKLDYKTGKIYAQADLERRYFGEGISILNDTIYQLTWQSGKVFAYDLQLQKIQDYKLNHTSEGWGLCNDGTKLYQSDGSEKIWIINPKGFKEEDYINIYTNSHKITKINELEWVDGKIYSNIWMKNAVAVINPDTGAIENIIDFSDLVKQVKIPPQNVHDYVLNGIAYDKKTKHLFITGKRWDKMFEIEIIQP
jgi:glutamine cyclotransferase